MNRAVRITASTLGVYAGLLGIQHGYFETLQGNLVPKKLLINAIGASCQPEAVWHACFPALTLFPTLLITGIVAIMVGLMVVIWSVGFTHRKHFGLILVPLSMMMIPVGGGFVPAFIGVLAGIAGIKTNSLLNWWQTRSSFVMHILSMLWPWNLIVLVLWLPGGWVLGHFFNQIMLNLGMSLFFMFDLGLPLLIVISSFAYVIHINKYHL